MRVLLVDDSPREIDRYGTHIRSLGHEVVAATDGRDATWKLFPDLERDTTIKAVVTDTRMGEYSGIYLLQYLSRSSPPPCLLHSSDPTFTLNGDEFDLATLIPGFGFATFHLKGEDLSYITEFLAKIA